MWKIANPLVLLLAAGSTLAAPTTDPLVERSQLMKRAHIGTDFSPEWSGGNLLPYSDPPSSWAGYIDESNAAANTADDEACVTWCSILGTCTFAIRVNVFLVPTGSQYYCIRYSAVQPKSTAAWTGKPGVVDHYDSITAFSRNSPNQGILPPGKTLGAKLMDPPPTTPILLWTKRSGVPNFDACKDACRNYQWADGSFPCVLVLWGQEANLSFYCDLMSLIFNPSQPTGGDVYVRNSGRPYPGYWANYP